VVASGANRVNNISFKAPEETITAVRLETLKEAAANAKKEAEAVLSSLGLSMKEIVQVQVNHAPAPMPPIHRAYHKEALAMSSADMSTPVEGGEQTINSSVTLTISY
ncbi:MAG TPA: SIMPL domain-containing protein, partial [Vampirovibrionales bacterium]